MIRRYILPALLIVFLFAGCTSDSPQPEPEADPEVSAATITDSSPSPEPAVIQMLPDDNPIDRAFMRVAGERNELDGNTIFSYLYALEWLEECNYLSRRLIDEIGFWSYDYTNAVSEAALEYGRYWVDSDSPTDWFDGIARYYKLIAFDYLARLNELGISMDARTNEEDIYQYLNEVNYTESKFDDFAYFQVFEAISDKYNPMPSLAALPDEDIYFYYSEFGAVMSIKGEKRLYPWGYYLTPRGILPEMAIGDYDGDGDDELAVILYVGSGTGVAIEELHVIELYGGSRFADTLVTGGMIESFLYHRLSALYDPLTDEVEVNLDNQTLRVDVSYVDKERSQDFRSLDLIDLVWFSADYGLLTVHISVGLCGFDYASPFNCVELYADVLYDSYGRITISNCRIEYTEY